LKSVFLNTIILNLQSSSLVPFK